MWDFGGFWILFFEGVGLWCPGEWRGGDAVDGVAVVVVAVWWRCVWCVEAVERRRPGGGAAAAVMAVVDGRGGGGAPASPVSTAATAYHAVHTSADHIFVVLLRP